MDAARRADTISRYSGPLTRLDRLRAVDFALQLENDVYKAVGMVDIEETANEDVVADGSKEKKETNKKK